MKKDLISHGKTIGQSISDLITYHEPSALPSNIQNIITTLAFEPEINYIYITDTSLNIVMATFFGAPPQAIKINLEQLATPETRHVNYLNSLEVTTPILHSGYGYIFIGMNQSLIKEKLNTFLPKLLVIILGLMLTCTILIYRTIKKIITPLEQLTEFTKDLERYQFDPTMINHDKLQNLTKINDEIGQFSQRFINLHQQLNSYIEKLTQAAIKSANINKEINIANKIHMELLPKPKNDYNNCIVSTFIQPAKDMGGDFYHISESHDTLFFAIGDVSGKGIPATLIAAEVLTCLQTTLHFLNDPEDIVTTVNKQISQNNPNMNFVTLFLGALNTKTGQLSYINAGHKSPYILNKNHTELPSTEGMALGIDE
ncbi:MAG: SpoIIE family protein phosphatase, partial [Candidatus Margulisiibacteriota bacterium]